MSGRRLCFYFSLAFFMVLLIGLPIRSQFTETQQAEDTVLVPGRNVNMVSGTTLPGGDPWLQRQNEPSIAVSTRNPLHLLAGANDYRTVDIPFSEGELPGKAQGAMAGDAWLGVYKSFDGGESWITSLIPGFPQDTSPLGMASPLKQFSTAADPIVRAGTNGLFYYSGMAFNRAQAKGGGSIFLTRFIDNNNVEGGDSIKYIDTKIIDQGTSGQFIDMPRIAVDIPRGSGTVTIDGQSIPRSNIYAAYTVFLGNTDVNIRSRIMFRRSTDCGATWGSAIKISESQHIIQGATIAIDPNSGAVYVAFRRFLHPSQTNSIVIVKSTDFGQTFSNPTVIAEINPFDQPATDAGGDDIYDPAGPSFRTNSYPTMTVDNSGIVYVAWTERGWGPSSEARIVMSTSQGGSGWSARWPVVNMADQDGFQGHQFMPSLTFAQGKLVLVWYDQRYDEYGTAYGHGNWIGDGMPIRHTTDVRCAQTEPGLMPALQPSIQVSKYLWALKPGSDTELEQEQFNPPNFEMFKGGTTPFHGDYVEIAPSPQFVLGANGWKFNTEPSSAPVYHAVWTDNRDVRPPADGNWTKYTPPSSDQPGFGSVACESTSPSTMGMRNQNIYASRLIQGVLAASPGNSKTLGDLGSYYDPENGLIPRAFVVYVQNPGGDIKTFRLTIVDSDEEGADPKVDGSFEEFEDLEELDVMIAPYSTIARTVFVRSSDEKASVRVDVVEIYGLGGQPVPGGLTASVVLNPDPTSPGYSPGDEYHDPSIPMPNIVNWDELNPNIVNPNIRNPNIRNWDEINPNIVNPNIRNPNIVNPNIRNPNIVNPNIRNPNIVNPNIVNPNIRNYTVDDFDGAQVSDVVFEIKNEGNTTSTYTLKTYSKESLPDAVYAQLLVYRVHYTPSGDYYSQTSPDCELRMERHHELLLNVTNPNIRNPNIVNPNIRNPNIRNGGLDNATFAVPPGEEVEAILRIIDFAPGTTQGQFRIMTTGQRFSTQSFAESIGFAVTSHAYNTDDARTTPEEELSYPTSATKLVISTTALPDGVVGSPYSATLWADGGTAPYYWALNAGELPPGLSLGTGGSIIGTPTAAGLYHFVVRVDDSAGDFDTQEFSIYIDSDDTADPLTITTTSLPNGVLNYWYGTTLEATGGVWPRTWSLTGGSLPPGVSLDSSGVISGKILQEEGQDYPTSYSFTVQVTDRVGTTATKAFTIDVNVNTGEYFTISGTVYDESGYPLEGVVMRGLPNTPVTNASGYYSDTIPAGWSGTVEPFKAGYSFNPPSRTYDVITENMTEQNYNEPPSPAAWAKTYGTPVYDGAFYIQQTSDGGYIVSGGSDDDWILKLDDAGNVEWHKTYGGPSSDRIYSIQQTSDGGYIGTGSTFSFGAGESDLWVLKLDDEGNVEWQKTYGGSAGDFGWSIQQTSGGGYIVAGYTFSFGAGSADVWVLKLDDEGNVEWQKTYGGSGWDSAAGSCIHQISDGYMVAAGTNSFGAGVGDLWMLKLDNEGNIVWQKSYGGSRDDCPHSSQQTSDGGYIVAMRTWSFGAGNADFWVLKLDGEGNVEWQKTYGGPSDDMAYPIQQTSDGGYIVGGNTHSFGAGTGDLWVLKLDSAGDVVWQKTYGGSSRDWWLYPIQQTSDGGYITAGCTYSFGVGAGYADLWVLKLRPDGSIGTSCPSGIGAESSAIIGSTSVTPSVSTATVNDSAAFITDVTITPKDTTAIVQTQCQSYYGIPTKLAFVQQPSNTAAGSIITPAVTVEIQDAAGNRVITATDTVTLSLLNPGGATLSGTTSKSAVAGIATFDDLSIDKVGTGYKLRANSGSLTEVDSNPFDITVSLLPEINIKRNTTEIPDGGAYDFGSQSVGSNTDIVFTIENLGTSDLTISTPITITGTNSDQFSVQVQPGSPVAQADSTTFTIRFSPTSAGAKSASIAIGNNDIDENPYDITLTGTAVAALAAWAKTYGGTYYDEAYSIQQTSDGGYIVAGGTHSFGAGEEDAWVVKLDSTGAIVWQKTYGGINGDYARSIQQTSDGGYIVAGYTDSFGAGNHDVWVLKLDSAGAVVWQKTYGGTDSEHAQSIQQTSDGGYIVGGYTRSFGAGLEDAWVLKLDSAGAVVWQKTYGGTLYDRVYYIRQTYDGGYIVGGDTNSFKADGYTDAWVLKLDGAGAVVWQKTYGGTLYDRGCSIRQTSDGGYIVGGDTCSFGSGSVEAWVLKLDSAGAVVWQKIYSGTDFDLAQSIQQTSDGGYIVGGYTDSFGAGSRDFWVLKLKPDGSIDPSCSSGIGADSTAIPTSTSVTPSTSTATAVDSSATPANTSAVPANSSATVQTQCKSTP